MAWTGWPSDALHAPIIMCSVEGKSVYHLWIQLFKKFCFMTYDDIHRAKCIWLHQLFQNKQTNKSKTYFRVLPLISFQVKRSLALGWRNDSSAFLICVQVSGFSRALDIEAPLLRDVVLNVRGTWTTEMLKCDLRTKTPQPWKIHLGFVWLLRCSK